MAPDTPIWIDADPLLLAELLGNLIDNALRYGNETGRIVLIVGANPPSLTVEDDGPGIPPEERDRVFEAFYRSPGHGRRLGPGPGHRARDRACARRLVAAHQPPRFSRNAAVRRVPRPRKGAQLTRQEPTS